MRRETRLKQAMGYGRVVELPAPIYLQGALMGLLDPSSKPYYYVLPAGAENSHRNYVRCAHVDPKVQNYCATPLKTWNDWEEQKARLSITDGVQRVLVFLRGCFIRENIEEIVEFEFVDERRHLRLMALYLEEVMARIDAIRDWNLTVEEFAATRPDFNARVWMLDVLNSGNFDIMIQKHTTFIVPQRSQDAAH